MSPAQPDAMSPRQPGAMSPAQLVRRQVAIDAHRLSPDGRWLVYVRRSVASGAYRRHLWRVSAGGGPSRQLTSGAVLDTEPAISPDGRLVAFLRAPADPDAKPADRDAQVHVVPAGGGVPWALGRLPHGASGVAWSPDGRTLAILAPAREARFIVGTVSRQREPVARRITRFDFRDDTGFRDHRVHLWLASARRGGRPRQLTAGDFDVEEIAWSPDGRTIAFTTDPGPDPGVAPRRVLHAVTVADGARRPLAALRGDLWAPAWSPDGRWLAAFGTDLADPPEATQPELWLLDPASGTARSLSAGLDLPGGVWASTHLSRAAQPEGPTWLDERTVVALFTRRGRVVPWRLTLDGEAAPLVAGDRRVVAGGLAVGGGRVVVNAQVDGAPSDLHARESTGLRRITPSGGAWRRPLPEPRLEELTADTPAGPIQVWLISPPTARERPLPTILEIHGGPSGSWGPGISLDALALTAAGYRVARPNIRGSAGFGRRWIDALGHRWGDVDAADLEAVTNWLVAARLADPHRLGLLGLSYGGFLVNWVVGVTDRYQAAVSENGVTNQATAWAECYFGIYDTRRSGLGDPLSDAGMRRLWARSPLRNVARIHTPLLLLQAAEDRICPASDNVQLFAALRALGREVEYVLYPEEHHVMQMIGRPDRRIDRLERVLDWFDRHLGSGGRGQQLRRAGQGLVRPRRLTAHRRG